MWSCPLASESSVVHWPQKAQLSIGVVHVELASDYGVLDELQCVFCLGSMSSSIPCTLRGVESWCVDKSFFFCVRFLVKKKLGRPRRPMFRAPSATFLGGACGAHSFKNFRRVMRIPNMCLVSKLDNGKVVCIAKGQTDRITV